ncbi:SPOSA6832_04063 [Sporobolomyces salmonicolor]|uniref:ATP-dependent DNA helicase n=1 Tax=Sporidiobolus salmonicolor TaxID=5005 RepID=A0A0D6ER68_SPOSA|nr:SPOSA6832_04063 [Sporobolomyces salmonicolor]
MPPAKRPRLLGPSLSASSALSSSDDKIIPPVSSLSALGQRLAKAMQASSSTLTSCPIASSSSQLESSRSRGPGAERSVAEVAEVKEEDEIMDVDDEVKPMPSSVAAPFRETTAPPPPPRSQSPTFAKPKMEPTSTPPPPVTPAKPFPSQMATPTEPLGSPTATQAQRRSKEEIAKKREAALAIKEAEELRKTTQERQQQRRELAHVSLAEFGFQIKPGMSRYGSGKGGGVDKDVPVDKPEEWKPDARCSEEQLEVLRQVREGGNVFFTGSAGVGKSFLLKEITRLLEHIQRPYQITATTGIAALQVDGTTIHSWAGVGLGKEPISVLYDRIVGSKEKIKNWTGVKVLIIDEISMSSAELFSKMNILGKLLRENPKPFGARRLCFTCVICTSTYAGERHAGGLQLIISGDFFQLPPVPDRRNDMKCMACGHNNLKEIPLHDAHLPYEERPKGIEQAPVIKCVDTHLRTGGIKPGCHLEWRVRRFVFETEAWAECNFKVMELTKVFRQSDLEFIAVLEKLRRGICDQACIDLLATCGTELGKGGLIKIKPTNLYPTRDAVNKENTSEFDKLKEETYTFASINDSRGEYARSIMKERVSLALHPPLISCKQHIDQLPGSLSQLNAVPAQEILKLKKGAQVLLLANLDVKRGLVNGSRGVIVDWIPRNLVPDVDTSISANGGKAGKAGKIGSEEWRQRAADEFMDEQKDDVYPVVFFACGEQGQSFSCTLVQPSLTVAPRHAVVIQAHSWCIDLDAHNAIARTQLPLQLAWALTIHKSQGQSLDAVSVRLNATFEKGQAYVALSRCRTPAGMKVEGFREGLLTLIFHAAHPTVKIFYDCIAQKTPFFITPTPPVHPLRFVPDFDPLIHKLSKVFGPIPKQLPVGSAVLAPGQTAPPPQPAAPAPRPASTSTSASTAAAGSAANGSSIAHSSWKGLLQEAAKAYVGAQKTVGVSGGIVSVDDSAFVTAAVWAVASAIGVEPNSGKQEDDDAVESVGVSTLAEMDTLASAGPAAQPKKQKELKKQKKKRVRKKRVGH